VLKLCEGLGVEPLLLLWEGSWPAIVRMPNRAGP
jgi:hypothetical protein